MEEFLAYVMAFKSDNSEVNTAKVRIAQLLLASPAPAAAPKENIARRTHTESKLLKENILDSLKKGMNKSDVARMCSVTPPYVWRVVKEAEASAQSSPSAPASRMV
jgi:hypothetical protein